MKRKMVSIEDAWQRTKGKNFLRNEEQLNHPIRKMMVERGVGKTVLDVGSATCVDYPAWTAAGFNYTGLDFTPKFLDAARELYPGISLIQADASKIPLEDNSMDTGAMKDVLEHLPPEKYIAVVKEMWRVANKRMIIAFYIAPINAPTKYVLIDNLHYKNRYNEAEILTLFRELPGSKISEIVKGIGFNNSSLYVVDRVGV